MAYQFADTFDHYNTAFLTGLGLYELVNGSPVISSAYARFPAVGSYPNQGIYLNAGAGLVRKNLKSNQANLIAFFSLGCALPGSNYCTLISFYDNGTLQCSLDVTSTGALAFYRAGTLLVSSSAGLIQSTSVPAHGIEVQIVFHGSAGTVQCWLDGVQVIPLTTGLNTIQSANAYANQVGLGYAYGTGCAIYSDYLRVWDNTGSYQNAPLGLDRRKLTKLPASAGDLTQWTPNGAASNWQCCDDASPDADTTYVSSNGNNYDSYGMGTSGLGLAPSMVVAKSCVRKDDANSRSIQIGVRSSGTNGLGAAFSVGTSYAITDACISVDPATGVPPTAAAADAFQHVKYESA
jgi:hypothetical protein